MKFFQRSDHSELLQKVQNTLDVLAKQLENQSAPLNDLKNDVDKQRAAYALNLCTVSISQIIDYNDLNFMEREYESILNNLNLEQMPKDEALLHILKQILDVITFFRIQDGDKKLLEKEYQQKVKDAIWSAVPNFNMLITSSSVSPWMIVGSLAAQVGTGYMNYRKEKARIALEKEHKDWELQRSAIEQLNGLRRELFDTAWRLADRYEFPDEYRITERQIAQYNVILLDLDDLRRYERLLYIKDSFKAYPPFWYYLGNAATAVCLKEGLSEELRADYKQKAKSHFSEYLKQIEDNSLLREDQLAATCALEYFDLLEDDEIDYRRKLLSIARKHSGNAFDVLQLCAISYMKIGDFYSAASILRMLVNEDYNKKVNAQMLSGLYVKQALAGEHAESVKSYTTLKLRVPDISLYPMPSLPCTADDCKILSKQFLDQQKNDLLLQYADALERFIRKYEFLYNSTLKWRQNVAEGIIQIFKEMFHATDKLEAPGSIFSDTVYYMFTNTKQELNQMIQDIESQNEPSRRVSFSDLAETALNELADKLIYQVSGMTQIEQIAQAESELTYFYDVLHLSEDAAPDTTDVAAEYDDLLSVEEIFGAGRGKRRAMQEEAKTFVKIMQREEFSSEKLVLKKGARLGIYYLDDANFGSYAKRHKNLINESVFAILNDTSASNTDLIFTTRGIIVSKGKRIKAHTPYANVEAGKKNGSLQFDSYNYTEKNVNTFVLHKLIQELAAQTHNGEKIADADCRNESLASRVTSRFRCECENTSGKRLEGESHIMPASSVPLIDSIYDGWGE